MKVKLRLYQLGRLRCKFLLHSRVLILVSFLTALELYIKACGANYRSTRRFGGKSETASSSMSAMEGYAESPAVSSSSSSFLGSESPLTSPDTSDGSDIGDIRSYLESSFIPYSATIS